MSPDLPAVPLSRRRVLLSSLAAAVAVPLAALSRPGRASAGGGEMDEAYQKAFQELVAGDPEVRRYLAPGREFLYRPGQLLVAERDTERVLEMLRQLGYPAEPAGNFAGVTKLRVERESDIPALVAKLRDPELWRGEPVPGVQPHHVTVGFPNIMGNPGGPPRVAAALPAPDPAREDDGKGVTVGVCDTGIWADAGSYHPQWLAGSYLPEPDDEDPVYQYANVLALQGAHGTFIAGVVRQAAPGVHFDPEVALTQSGLGDEEMVTGAIARLGSTVAIVNLSLGCYTQDDLPSIPLAEAVAALPDGVVVVAAAGNSGISRPSWPAALPEVLAVAAVREDNGKLGPADYSNFGPWVDLCAHGDRVSTYAEGTLVLPGVPNQTFKGFAAWAGTSFATGHVSGQLATVMTQQGLDAEQARLVLLGGPVPFPGYGALVP